MECSKNVKVRSSFRGLLTRGDGWNPKGGWEALKEKNFEDVNEKEWTMRMPGRAGGVGQEGQ